MASRKGTAKNDVFFGGGGGEHFDGSGGYDIVSYAKSKMAVGIDLDNPDVKSGGAKGDTYTSIEAFRLSQYDDTFAGSAKSDNVNGGAGDDMLDGRDGNDALAGDVGNDALYGGAGNDGLWSGGGKDALFGGEDNDWLDGGSGNDQLNGGSNKGVFTAAVEKDQILIKDFAFGDILTGGSGSDTFNFVPGESGVVLITDFNPGLDHISLEERWFDGDSGNGEFRALEVKGGAMIVFTEKDGQVVLENSAIYLARIEAASIDKSFFL